MSAVLLNGLTRSELLGSRLKNGVFRIAFERAPLRGSFVSDDAWIAQLHDVYDHMSSRTRLADPITPFGATRTDQAAVFDIAANTDAASRTVGQLIDALIALCDVTGFDAVALASITRISRKASTTPEGAKAREVTLTAAEKQREQSNPFQKLLDDIGVPLAALKWTLVLVIVGGGLILLYNLNAAGGRLAKQV